MTTSDDAAKTVKEVVTTNHDKGAHDAGTKLHDDFVTYSQKHSADETRAYWDQVNQQMDKGLLTTLAFDWAKGNKEVSNMGGVVNRGDTQKELKHNQDTVAVAGDNVQGSAEFKFKAMMEKELIDAFDHSKKGDKGYEWMSRDGSYVSSGVIGRHLDSIERDRKDQVGKEALRTPELMKALQSPDGKSPSEFWKSLADKDGHVTQEKLDDYIKQAKGVQTLPDKFNPQDQEHTKYNAEWLKAAEQLKSNTEKLQNGDLGSGFLWLGHSGHIDQESLAKGLGYKDAATMLGENKKTEVAPVGDQTTGGSAAPPADLASRANGIVKTVAMLPGDATSQILDKGMTKADAQKLLDTDSTDHNLSVNQRDTLTKLRDDWDTVIGKDKTLDVKSLTVTDGKPSATVQSLKETSHAAQDGLAKLNGADMSALVDNGAITKDKVDAFLAKKPDGMSDDDYTKGKERAQFLKDNFNDISHDGTTISHDNLKQYAAALGATDKYQDYKDSAASPPAGADQATKDAQAKLDALKQSDHLNKGEVPYDMAKRILEERSKVTGEATDGKAIMREVARLCITNGIGKPEVIAHLQKKLDDPNYRFSDKDLPKELNYVRYNQNLKIYTDAEKAKYVDAIKTKAGVQASNRTARPDQYKDGGETDGKGARPDQFKDDGETS